MTMHPDTIRFPTGAMRSGDADRERYDLISPIGLRRLAETYAEGAAKYGRHNYRAVGVRASVYYDATMRHLMRWWEGEDNDPDSGLSHVTKAIASLAVLRDATLQGKLQDDRPPSSPNLWPALDHAAWQILDRHADKNPHHYTIADGVQQ